MALRGTLTHRKTRRLAEELHISQSHALGLLEALWHVTAQQAMAGDIGRMSNEDIAAEIYWAGDPDALIHALVKARYIDEDKTHRLLTHDWHEHADYNIKRRLARFKKVFHTRFGDIDPKVAIHGSTGAPKEEQKEVDTGDDTPDPDSGASERVKTRHDAPSQKPETGNPTPETRNLKPEEVKPSCASASDALMRGQQASLLPDEPETQKPDGKVREIRKAEALWNKEFEDEFWPLSWLRVGKKDAKKAYCAARRRGESKEKLLEAARSQGPMILAAARDKGGTPLHPATWLNKERYNDEALPIESARPASRRQVASDLLEAELLAEEQWRAS